MIDVQDRFRNEYGALIARRAKAKPSHWVIIPDGLRFALVELTR